MSHYKRNAYEDIYQVPNSALWGVRKY